MLHSNTICEEGEKSTRPDPRKAIPSHPAGHHVMTCGAESMRAGADDTFPKVRCIHVSFFFKKNPTTTTPKPSENATQSKVHRIWVTWSWSHSVSRKHPCILLDPWLGEPSKGRAHLDCATRCCPQHGQLAWLQSIENRLGGERRLFVSRNATLSPVQARPSTPGHGAARSMAAQGCHPQQTQAAWARG